METVTAAQILEGGGGGGIFHVPDPLTFKRTVLSQV